MQSKCLLTAILMSWFGVLSASEMNFDDGLVAIDDSNCSGCIAMFMSAKGSDLTVSRDSVQNMSVILGNKFERLGVAVATRFRESKTLTSILIDSDSALGRTLAIILRSDDKNGIDLLNGDEPFCMSEDFRDTHIFADMPPKHLFIFDEDEMPIALGKLDAASLRLYLSLSTPQSKIEKESDNLGLQIFGRHKDTLLKKIDISDDIIYVLLKENGLPFKSEAAGQ